MINIRDDEPKVTQLDLSMILPGVTEGKFLGKVESLKWNNNSDSVLAKIAYEEQAEWILINLKDTKQSLNLTRTFGLEFTQVEMIDDGAAQLFALENQHLRRINTGDQSISRVLLHNVLSFANSKTNVIYVMSQATEEETEKVVGVYRDGEKGGTTLVKASNNAVVTVALTRYYDEDYLAYAINNELSVYYGALPTYREDAQNTDFSSLKTLMDKVKLQTAPTQFSLSPEGEYIIASRGRQFTVVDLEMGELIEYEAMASDLAWLDEAMLTAVVDDALWVWDFDDGNRREMVRYVAPSDDTAAEGVQTAPITTISHTKLANYPAVIADNNRWIYYLTESKTGLALTRERIRD